MFTCHKDHTQHCSTYSIDVVSKWSCSHSYCFSWSNILHSNQAAAQQQEAAAGKQQAGTRGNQVPGSSRRRNDVKTTYKRRMKRRWNQTLATPGPEWAAPIPAAPAELSSRKINPWAKERQAPNQLDTTGVPNGTAGSKQQQCKSLSRRW